MPAIEISPVSLLLSPGQTATFAATVGGQAASVSWALSPGATGTLGSSPGSTTAPGLSVTYVAPATIATPQVVSLIATSGADSASATISLTADILTIIPATASLKGAETQSFIAVLASAQAAEDEITWVLTPPIGKLMTAGVDPNSAPVGTPATGGKVQYTAPPRFRTRPR